MASDQRDGGDESANTYVNILVLFLRFCLARILIETDFDEAT